MGRTVEADGVMTRSFLSGLGLQFLPSGGITHFTLRRTVQYYTPMYEYLQYCTLFALFIKRRTRKRQISGGMPIGI